MDCFNLIPLKLLFLFVGGIFWFCKAAGGLIRKSFSTASIKSINQKKQHAQSSSITPGCYVQHSVFPYNLESNKEVLCLSRISVSGMRRASSTSTRKHCTSTVWWRGRWWVPLCSTKSRHLWSSWSRELFRWSFHLLFCEPLECELLYCFKNKILQWLKFI